RRDLAYRPGHHAAVPADAGGKAGLIPWTGWGANPWNDAAGGTVDQVDASGREPPRQFYGLLQVPAILNPVGRRDADPEGQPLGPDAAHSGDHLEQQPDAVLERAAVAILAPVAQRGKKF